MIRAMVACNDILRATLQPVLANDDWELARYCSPPLLLVKDKAWVQNPTFIAAVDPEHSHDKPASLDHKLILMVAGSRDVAVPKAEHHDPLAQAFHNRNMTTLTEVVLETDHDYSNARILLAKTVLDWLVQ